MTSRGRVYCKSASLPLSSSLERYDDQDVRHKSPSMDADSSAYNSSEYSDDVDQDLSQGEGGGWGDGGGGGGGGMGLVDSWLCD